MRLIMLSLFRHFVASPSYHEKRRNETVRFNHPSLVFKAEDERSDLAFRAADNVAGENA